VREVESPEDFDWHGDTTKYTLIIQVLLIGSLITFAAGIQIAVRFICIKTGAQAQWVAPGAVLLSYLTTYSVAVNITKCKFKLDTTKSNIFQITILTIAMTASNSIIPIAVYIPFSTSYEWLEVLQTIIIFNVLILCIVSYTNWQYVIDVVRRFKLRRNLYNGINQTEANRLCERPYVNIAMRYALVMSTLIGTCVIVTTIPISMCMSAVGLLVFYHNEKYASVHLNHEPKLRGS
jgi:hypothetical protein